MNKTVLKALGIGLIYALVVCLFVALVIFIMVYGGPLLFGVFGFIILWIVGFTMAMDSFAKGKK